MERDDVYAAKLMFLGECWTEVMNRRVAFNVTEKSQKAGLESLAEIINVNTEDLKGFSHCLEALNKDMDVKGHLRWDLFEKQLKRLGDAAKATPDIDILRRPFLDPNFRFSDEWDDAFKAEFLAVTYFCIMAEGVDPLVDLALMKIFFSFGKIIERLDRDGYVHSDLPRSGGNAEWKGYVSHEQVIDEAKKVSKALKVESRRRIAHLVRERLDKAESNIENPKEVYTEDYIRKHILPKK